MQHGKGFWLFVAIALLVMAVYNLMPFFWMISSSFKTDIEVTSYPATLLPQAFTTDAYARIWEQEGFILYFLNSIKVSGGTAILSATVGVFAAYGFSRFRFQGRTALMATLLVTQMLPGVLLVGPYFKMLSLVDLYDTHLGLILAQTSITLPFTVWMLKGYIDTIPVEIDQAAMIDGATRLQSLVYCVFPNILPGLVATTVFSFLLAWGDLLWALCLITTPEKQTMTLGITNLVGQFRVLWSDIMAATVIGCAIPAFFYLLLQRYLITGVAGAAVKG